DRTRRTDFEARAEHRALETGGGVGIADESVREDERCAVHRPRLRNAITELTWTPQVLHRRLGPGLEDLYQGTGTRAIATPVPRRNHRRRLIDRAIRVAPSDLVVLRAINSPESHVVARAQEDRIAGQRIIELQRRAAENPIASRTVDGVNAALDAAD